MSERVVIKCKKNGRGKQVLMRLQGRDAACTLQALLLVTRAVRLSLQLSYSEYFMTSSVNKSYVPYLGYVCQSCSSIAVADRLSLLHNVGRRRKKHRLVVEENKESRRTFNKNSCYLLTAITHTEILVAYF